jgi:hemolysin D
MRPYIASRPGSLKVPNSVVAFPTARRRDYELAFLPAALEVVETPPSPIGRAIAMTIVAVICIGLTWASVGFIDIYATAPGRIIPNGRSKIVQPFEISVVRAINVHDGENVKKGDVLIELDPTINAADSEHLRSDLISAQLDVARLHAALSDSADPTAAFDPPEGASPDQIATQQKFLTSQTGEQRAKLATLDHQLTEKEAERDTSQASINKIGALIPLLQQQVDIRQTLFEHETGSRIVYLQTLQQLVEQQQELEVQRAHYRESDASIATISEERTKAAEQYRQDLFDQLTKAETKAAGIAQDLVKAEQRTRLQRLIAPIDGVVEQLAVHTEGAVVTPAQALLVVVPADADLEIEAAISNQDIGFVHPGQEADIKVGTFNFTRYGLLHGRISSVSPDAFVPDPRVTNPPGANPEDNTQDRGSRLGTVNATAKETIYTARISLDQSAMQIDGKLVRLLPGMTVTVEVKTGSRRIISYLLSPLLKYGHESLHER